MEHESLSSEKQKQCTRTDSTQSWNYAFRREMQEVFPNLYLGPFSVASKSKLPYLLEHGITHIVCIRQALDSAFIRPHFEDHFRYLVLNMVDSKEQNIIQFIPQIQAFLDSCFQSGGKALVHGNSGTSRSAALVIGYIMEKLDIDFQTAHRIVLERRFCINLNEGFVHQLKEYEPIYRARKMMEGGHQSMKAHSSKRKFAEDEADLISLSKNSGMEME